MYEVDVYILHLVWLTVYCALTIVVHLNKLIVAYGLM